MEGVSKRYGDQPVLEDVSLTVMRGARVAIIGPNGIGKSTLLKVAVGEVEAEAGSSEWGYETYPGYVAQDQKAQLGTQRQTLEDWLTNLCPGQSIGFVRGHLAAVLFSGDEVDKKLEALSGGEAARLVFARQIVEKPNVLILDEPTNHLDLEAIEALVEGLKAYEGTILFVSHDRWFVGELATRVIEITHEGIQDFPGSYEEYLERCGDDHLDVRAVLRKARESKRETRSGQNPAANEQAGKRKGRRRGPKSGTTRSRQLLQRRLDEVTAEIESSENRLSALNERFCEPDFYDATPVETRQDLEEEHARLSVTLSDHMQEWESLEAEIGSLPEP